MSFDNKQIEAVAKLAMLRVDEHDMPDTIKKMNGIMTLIDQMQSVNTDQVQPLSHPQDPVLRLREDTVTQSDQREAFQTLTEFAEQGLYTVPKVIE